jgi:hypothetical protein
MPGKSRKPREPREPKSERFEMAVTATWLARVRAAAAGEGQTVTAFVLAAVSHYLRYLRGRE